uniref:Uncharacterized protein n=1 Tax=Timema bartmani TaxID=61472 RepID=A0A7R9ER75_9NEOP|nr:unnamed protein product [Timema bartmani]
MLVQQCLGREQGDTKYPYQDSKSDLPNISSLVYCDIDALDHVATEAGFHDVSKGERKLR